MAATLRIHRNKHLRAAMRDVKVVVDGKPVGFVKNGEEASFPLPPGEHVVSLQVFPFAQSPEVKIQASADEEHQYKCGVEIGLNKNPNLIWFLIFGPLLVLGLCFGLPQLGEGMLLLLSLAILGASVGFYLYFDWHSRNGIYLDKTDSPDS